MYGPNQDVSVYRRANLSHLLPNGPRTSTWDHLVEDMLSVLKKVKPALVVTPHPDLDSHPDHEFVTVALLDAPDESAPERSRCRPGSLPSLP